MLQISGSVQRGSLPVYGGGSSPIASQGPFGELFLSELAPRYFGLVDAGLVFGTAWAAAALATPSATALGAFGFWNKTGSGKNCILLRAQVGMIDTTAVATLTAVGLLPFPIQVPSGVSAGNPAQNALIGSGNASITSIYSAATIVGGATIPLYNLASISQDLTTGAQIGAEIDIGGAVIVSPGCGFGLAGYGGTAADTTITFSLLWAEIPTP